MSNYRNKKLTQSAKHESCVSCGNPECSWCHSNEYKHGKSRGMKAGDIFGFYGCTKCHDWYDGRSIIEPPSFRDSWWYDSDNMPPKKQWFREMWERSILIASTKGYL
jgi:hypothetical protein